MSVSLLPKGRALPLTFFLEEAPRQPSHAELRSEGIKLCGEIATLQTPSAWQFGKGVRLIEIGELLNDAVLIGKGHRFLLRLCVLIK